jgi:hypothetical protein
MFSLPPLFFLFVSVFVTYPQVNELSKIQVELTFDDHNTNISEFLECKEKLNLEGSSLFGGVEPNKFVKYFPPLTDTNKPTDNKKNQQNTEKKPFKFNHLISRLLNFLMYGITLAGIFILSKIYISEIKSRGKILKNIQSINNKISSHIQNSKQNVIESNLIHQLENNTNLLIEEITKLKQIQTDINQIKPIFIPTKDTIHKEFKWNISCIEPNKIITSKLIMSAGPRKQISKSKFDDTEFGEDVAGVMGFENGIFYWVIDGTSDSNKIKDENGNVILSSRVLAQYLGNSFSNQIEKAIKAKNDFFKLRSILEDAIKETKEAISISIGSLTTRKLEDYLQQDNTIIDVSATFNLGLLTHEGYFEFISIGDTKSIAFSNNSEKIEATEGADTHRLFFYLKKGENNMTTIEFNRDFYDLLKNHSYNYVQSVICYSDGIRKSETPLIISRGKAFDNISNINQGTNDDKTLIALDIIQI